MPCRCADVALDEMFDERFARRDADHYRRKGLPKRARILLALLRNVIDLTGKTSLEGGAGAGALTVDLARLGARHARGVDATTVAVQCARSLAVDFKVEDRVEFEVGDFADAMLALPRADIVILDRVVCCYPDWRALLTRAATHADRAVALSYPPGNRLSSVEVGAFNALQKRLGRKFRLHRHSPVAMLGLLADNGFTALTTRRYWFWEIAVAARP
jgi:SAM-dependent methyltransferase